jgi:hypothetical protein
MTKRRADGTAETRSATAALPPEQWTVNSERGACESSKSFSQKLITEKLLVKINVSCLSCQMKI